MRNTGRKNKRRNEGRTTTEKTEKSKETEKRDLEGETDDKVYLKNQAWERTWVGVSRA